MLIGHGNCFITIEASIVLKYNEVNDIVKRIAGNNIKLTLVNSMQDKHLAKNQSEEIRCGDNGIFKGVPLTDNEKRISILAKGIYNKYPYDGKYILTNDKFIICQSNAKNEDLISDLVDLIKEDMEVLDDEQELIIYVKNTRTLDESRTFIEEVFAGNTLNEDNLLDEDEKWNVYLINLAF